MSDIEILMTTVGELVACDIEEVDRVEYAKDKKPTFIIFMMSGKRYLLELKAMT